MPSDFVVKEHHRIIFAESKPMADNAPEPIISVSGLRGVIGESLTPDLAARYVAAFSRELGEGPMVVTRDGRESGPMLVHSIKAALFGLDQKLRTAVQKGGTARTLLPHLKKDRPRAVSIEKMM